LSFLDRVAGAPITWGVDGSPGWGHLMDRERVMTEMAAVGLSATELGPDGYLPRDPGDLAEFLEAYALQMVGGFVPALLYRDEVVDRQLEYVGRAAEQLAAGGSAVLVLGPSSHHDGYDTSVDMDDDEWSAFTRNLQRLEMIVEGAGLQTALHPHWGMAIERGHHVERLLETSDVGLCLDTGHLYLAGVDPVDIARTAGDRVLHVHLKDVAEDAADRVRSGAVSFRQAVVDGMFVSLGKGAVDIGGVVEALEAIGYAGWYVLEQDRSLAAEPGPGTGPMADAAASVEFLRNLDREAP